MVNNDLANHGIQPDGEVDLPGPNSSGERQGQLPAPDPVGWLQPLGYGSVKQFCPTNSCLGYQELLLGKRMVNDGVRGTKGFDP